MGEYEIILKRARNGSLTREALQHAARQLQSPVVEVGDKLTILRSIALMNAQQYTPQLEALLHESEDDMISRLALVVLSQWHTDGRYNDYILEKMSSTLEEDIDGFQCTAISLAGEWLPDHEDRRLMEALISLFEDEVLDVVTREAAYTAIARAMGHDWFQLPSYAEALDLVSDVSHQLLSLAKTRCENAPR